MHLYSYFKLSSRLDFPALRANKPFESLIGIKALRILVSPSCSGEYAFFLTSSHLCEK